MKTLHFTNPFYNDYNVLIDLSKDVINNQGAEFDSKNESSAFFFDVSMLFEYFIRKMMKRDGIRLLSKFEQRYEIPTGSFGKYVRKLEPDIVFENNDGFYIFDVKYKAFDPVYGVKREDIFQLHTYIGQYSNAFLIKGCGFIYPISEDKWKSFGLDRSSGLISDVIHQQKNEIPFYILFLMVPTDSTVDYCKVMRESCERFLEQIKKNIILLSTD
jgi:5-methylcytosine-specific restriction endonuclease McrBC regulatory subunit McrC